MSGAAGRRAREAARVKGRRRRAGWITTVVVVAALVGTVLGLHFTAGSAASSGPSTPVAATGQPAPDGTFTTVSGQQASVASLRGKPTLLWFVTTWCSSCQAGTQAMAANIDRFRTAGARVLTLELYQNLGQSGPAIGQFGQQLAGPAYTNPAWQFGTASERLTRSYDPKSYLDIYYLLDRDGTVVYVNGSPASTMNDLLTQVRKLA